MKITDEDKRLVWKAAQRSNAPVHAIAKQRSQEADAAPTILGRVMALRGWDTAKAAEKCGLLQNRVASIAAGTSKPYNFEVQHLEKTFGESAELLSSANTVENHAKQRPLI